MTLVDWYIAKQFRLTVHYHQHEEITKEYVLFRFLEVHQSHSLGSQSLGGDKTEENFQP